MALHIGEQAPNFTAETTEGTIDFHDWIGDGWAILFSHPKDFTPVCTTELGYMAGLKSEFAKRNCKVIGLSIDPVSDHKEWAKDIEETQGHAVNYPIVGDSDMKVAKLYDMLHPEASGPSEGRTAADNATVRSVFAVGPDKKIKLMLTYPMTTDATSTRSCGWWILCSSPPNTRWRRRSTGKQATTSSSCPRFRTSRRKRNTPTAGRR